MPQHLMATVVPDKHVEQSSCEKSVFGRDFVGCRSSTEVARMD